MKQKYLGDNPKIHRIQLVRTSNFSIFDKKLLKIEEVSKNKGRSEVENTAWRISCR